MYIPRLITKHSTAVRESVLAVIKVGADKTKYIVHRSLLMKHSEYFRKALTGSWKEAQEGVVTLEDVDCDACKYIRTALNANDHSS